MTSEMMWIVTAVIATFLVLLAFRVHVGFSLAVAGALGVVCVRGFGPATSVVTNQPYSTAANYSLTIIPLFIFMGVLAIRSGLAEAGFNVAARLLCRIPGGSAVASLVGSGLFAAVTGSSVATVATMAKVSTDAILRAGHHIRLAAGVVCAGGTLGVLIPPSIVLVLYGVVTGESIGVLLLAGIGPGLLTIVAYSVTAMILARIQQKKALPVQQPAPESPISDAPSAPMNSVATSSSPASAKAAALPTVDIPAVVYLFAIFTVSIGTIYLGVATPTEAASFGALAAFIILLLRHRPRQWLAEIRESLRETIGLTSMTFLLMFGAGVFTYFLALSGATNALVDTVIGADMNPYVVLVLCLLILIPLGMFLDGVSIILITAPLLHPILVGYGFEGVWLGIVVVKVAEMALITPPVGMNAFVYSGSVKGADLPTVFRGIVPFIIADVVVVLLLIAFPDIVSFLPGLSGAK